MHLQERLLNQIFGSGIVSRLPKEVPEEPRSQHVVELGESRVVTLRVAIHRAVDGGIGAAFSLGVDDVDRCEFCLTDHGGPLGLIG